eukprot:TRINITY_DN139817_c0_g1_i1.p1 TRINITY_DN139817_c0_g1~~TRINITY_DN139817_c0_g1_i1.p1  ORF type:complete len:537 (+),score=27.66 TRINITY_DN139817_c0_g1_i1:72-1613(+)
MKSHSYYTPKELMSTRISREELTYTFCNNPTKQPFINPLVPTKPPTHNGQGKFVAWTEPESYTTANYFFIESASVYIKDKAMFLIGFAITVGHFAEGIKIIPEITQIKRVTCAGIRLTNYTPFLFAKMIDPITGVAVGHLDFSLWAVLSPIHIAVDFCSLGESSIDLMGSAFLQGYVPPIKIPIQSKSYLRYATWLEETPHLVNEVNKVLNEASSNFCTANGEVIGVNHNTISFHGSSLPGMCGAPLFKQRVAGFLIGKEVPVMGYESDLLAELCEKLGKHVFNDPLANRVFCKLIGWAKDNNWDIHTLVAEWDEEKEYFAGADFAALEVKLFTSHNKKMVMKGQPPHSIYASMNAWEITNVQKYCRKFTNLHKSVLENWTEVTNYFDASMLRKIFIKLKGILDERTLESLNIRIFGDNVVSYASSKSNAKSHEKNSDIIETNYMLNLNTISTESKLHIELWDNEKRKIVAKTNDINAYFLSAYRCTEHLKDGSICFIMEIPKDEFPLQIELN